MEDTRTIVGLDVSKNSIMATAVDPLGHRVEQTEIGADDTTLMGFLEGLPGEKLVVLEACGVWEHIHDAAASTGARVLLAHPLKTRLISETTLKTDRVDSEALALLGRLNAVPEAYAPTPAERALRRLVRERTFYERKRKDLASHTYSILLQVTGVCIVVVGVITENGIPILHILASFILFVCGGVGILLLGLAFSGGEEWRPLRWFSLVMGTVIIVATVVDSFTPLGSGGVAGLLERCIAYPLIVWFVGLGVFFFKESAKLSPASSTKTEGTETVPA